MVLLAWLGKANREDAKNAKKKESLRALRFFAVKKTRSLVQQHSTERPPYIGNW